MTNCCLTNVKSGGSGGGSGPATTTLTVLNNTGASLAAGDSAVYHYVATEDVGRLNPRGTSYLSSSGINAIGADGESLGYASSSTNVNIDSLTYDGTSLSTANLAAVTIPSGTASRYTDWGIRYSSTGKVYLTTYSTSSSSAQTVIHVDKTNYWSSSFNGTFVNALGYNIIAVADTTNLVTNLNYISETDGAVLATVSTNRWLDDGTSANKNYMLAIGVNKVILPYYTSAANGYILNIDWTNQAITESSYTVSSSQGWSNYYPKFATADGLVCCFGYANQQLISGAFRGILCSYDNTTNTMTEIPTSSLPTEMAAVFDGQSHSYVFVTYNHFNHCLTIVDGSNNSYSMFTYNPVDSSWTKLVLPISLPSDYRLYGPMTVSSDFLAVGYHMSSSSGSMAYRYLYFYVSKLQVLDQNVAVSPELAYQAPTDYHQGLATESIAAGSAGSLTIFDEENENV